MTDHVVDSRFRAAEFGQKPTYRWSNCLPSSSHSQVRLQACMLRQLLAALASAGASDSRNCAPIAIDANQYRFVYRDLCCLPHRSYLQYRDERIQRPNEPTTEA